MKSYKVVVHCEGSYMGEPCVMAIEAVGPLKQAEHEVAREMYRSGWKTVQRFQKPQSHYCQACGDMNSGSATGEPQS